MFLWNISTYPPEGAVSNSKGRDSSQPRPQKLKISVLLAIPVKVKFSRYRPGVAHRVGRGIPLLFHDRGTRRGWVVSSTPRPHFTHGKDPVPILHEAGWTPGPVWTDGKSRPHRDSIPDRPARSQSLNWLSYPAHSDPCNVSNWVLHAAWLRKLNAPINFLL